MSKQKIDTNNEAKRDFIQKFVLNRAIGRELTNVAFLVIDAAKAWQLIEKECQSPETNSHLPRGGD